MLCWGVISSNLETPLRGGVVFVDYSNKSKYIGVSLIAGKENWKSYITVNKKRITIGHFNTENDAVIARNNFILENNLINEFDIQEVYV